MATKDAQGTWLHCTGEAPIKFRVTVTNAAACDVQSETTAVTMVYGLPNTTQQDANAVITLVDASAHVSAPRAQSSKSSQNRALKLGDSPQVRLKSIALGGGRACILTNHPDAAIDIEQCIDAACSATR